MCLHCVDCAQPCRLISAEVIIKLQNDFILSLRCEHGPILHASLRSVSPGQQCLHTEPDRVDVNITRLHHDRVHLAFIRIQKGPDGGRLAAEIHNVRYNENELRRLTIYTFITLHIKCISGPFCLDLLIPRLRQKHDGNTQKEVENLQMLFTRNTESERMNEMESRSRIK